MHRTPSSVFSEISKNSAMKKQSKLMLLLLILLNYWGYNHDYRQRTATNYATTANYIATTAPLRLQQLTACTADK